MSVDVSASDKNCRRYMYFPILVKYVSVQVYYKIAVHDSVSEVLSLILSLDIRRLCEIFINSFWFIVFLVKLFSCII